MPKFKLTNKAVLDLSDIWDYTYETWNERQADKYYKNIISECKSISKNPEKGRLYDTLITNLRGFKTNKHIIFYRIIDNNIIEVERILHEKMDLKKYFADPMAVLSTKPKGLKQFLRLQEKNACGSGSHSARWR